MDVQKINEIGNEFKDLLQLDGSPVAVKLIPAGTEKDYRNYPKLDKQLRHCQIVDLVRRTGECFYTTAEDHLCGGGAAALGLGKLPEKVRTGEFYYGLHHFTSVEAGKKTIDQVPFLEPFSNAAVLYAPLESAAFEPDVVIFICKPKQAMLLTQAYVFKDGGRVHAEFSGKQSVCSDAVAHVVLKGQPNVTVGCGGSRNYAQITEEEMLYSLPVRDIEKTADGLNALVGDLK